MYRGAATATESFKGSGRGPYRSRGFDRATAAAPGRGGRSYRRDYPSHEASVEQSQKLETQSDSVWSNTLISSGTGCKWADQDTGDEVWSSPPAQETTLSNLECRIDAMSQEFIDNLRKLGEKGNEKFDLIFSILTELQNRQAQLEETVRVLQNQVNASYTSCTVGNSTSMDGNMNVSNNSTEGAPGNGTSCANNMAQMNNVMVVCHPNGMMQQMPQMMYAVPNMMTPMTFMGPGSEMSSPSGTSGFVSTGQESGRVSPEAQKTSSEASQAD
ncbi:unnamed protein product [Durusdinium trenchii]|uniref:Uncharacterized protein n=2 Tax=Durusdinium trenchii TaxID=1381693 RepID=A0ABP0JDE6_9DINO